ncbi:SDR family oxidoreductase [Phenylobacterium sp.]|uniref:SDR family oxidoreductase n=1 Tax=Phenylobacterium sp. TaxID=1871053 RepID=UPI00261CA286|nr:SDR family oxidoreductase [Phenylobacterium sp.]
MDFGLAGKRALVLGGSGGLGAASAMALAREGVRVTAAARDLDRIRRTYAEMGPQIAASITPQTVDLADRGSVQALIDVCLDDGDVDILVNNGGGPPPGATQDQTPETWEAAFATMAASLFHITAGLLPGMRRRGWGRIITIGSSGVEQPLPNLALSNAIRGSIAGWSKTLANEVAASGVTVNMVLPGRIDTDRVRSLDAGRAQASGRSISEVQAAALREIPAGRYGDAAEFGAVVAFLASAQASYVTGSMVRVDGGLIRSI